MCPHNCVRKRFWLWVSLKLNKFFRSRSWKTIFLYPYDEFNISACRRCRSHIPSLSFSPMLTLKGTWTLGPHHSNCESQTPHSALKHISFWRDLSPPRAISKQGEGPSLCIPERVEVWDKRKIFRIYNLPCFVHSGTPYPHILTLAWTFSLVDLKDPSGSLTATLIK